MHYMYHSGGWGGLEFLGMGTWPLSGILPFLVWILVWKGWALWLAARRDDKIWFTSLLILNTLGLLEIFYIFAVAKQKDTKNVKEKNTEPSNNLVGNNQPTSN